MGHTKPNMRLFISSLTHLGLASASSQLSDIVKSKEEATEQLVSRERRDIDPDTWCRSELKGPKCWAEFTETVWQPGRLFGRGNSVSRKEGRQLYWCVKRCTTSNGFLDFAGQAYEEKREKREEYQEVSGDKRKFVTGCPQCCKFIPDQLKNLQKVQKACPEQKRTTTTTEEPTTPTEQTQA